MKGIKSCSAKAFKMHCASSNDLDHGADLFIGGSGSLFDIKPLGADVASDGFGLSVF